MSINIKNLNELIGDSFDGLKEYIAEFENNSPLLGEKTQEGIRRKMHLLYGQFGSWMAGFLASHSEQDSAEAVGEKLSGAVKHFGPQTNTALSKQIDRHTQKLAERGKYNMADRVKNTYYHCATNVIERSKNPMLELAGKTFAKTSEKSEKTAIM